LVVCDTARTDFDRLHAWLHDGEVQFLGFGLLELDGTDLRQQPLGACRHFGYQ
jgi:hypothetical protein